MFLTGARQTGKSTLARALISGTDGRYITLDDATSLSAAVSDLKRYLTILEATFLLQPLAAWSSNLGKRLIKAPKIHLVDSGMVAYLCGLTEERLAEEPLMLRHLLEGFVFAELRKRQPGPNSMSRFST